MTYTVEDMVIEKARQDNKGYHFTVVVNPDSVILKKWDKLTEKEQQAYLDTRIREEFHWGLDVPTMAKTEKDPTPIGMEVIYRETRLLLKQKYENVEEVLSVEGSKLK